MNWQVNDGNDRLLRYSLGGAKGSGGENGGGFGWGMPQARGMEHKAQGAAEGNARGTARNNGEGSGKGWPKTSTTREAATTRAHEVRTKKERQHMSKNTEMQVAETNNAAAALMAQAMIKKLGEKKVILRSDQSGVWFGTLMAWQPLPTGGFTCTIADGVKVHYWTGAAATSGLAVTGPGEGSRLCPEVDVAVVRDCCEILLCTPKATEKFNSLPRWEP